ncbi:MAG: ADP-forming succinate--CoA ligase subunit beta, partial [Candidatus Aminicenantes bacterium]|nr:ADP-forming succinate--CoA ligase subunit beta [Candidatus Aminicenantes bacterium]
GKAGGVKLANSPDEVYEIAKKMLGMKLVTHQTGPEGKIVRKILVEEASDIAKEMYVGIVIDRSKESAVVMASPEGGVEIEEVAATHPELIFKEYVHPAVGLAPFQAKKLAYKLGLENGAVKEAIKFILGLWKAFEQTDASLAEINPLILTKQGEVMALDAKMNFDDNALYRHPEIKELRDIYEETPLEVEASKYNLNYIQLEGNVGCMVNGAGLAMATMDIIKYYGGEPANFLDVGGGANEEQIKNAFRILMADPNVKAVYINIFGGILRCDRLARGVVNAAREMKVEVPIVVRMKGTNFEEGKRIILDSGLDIKVANTMAEGAQLAVKLAGGKA